MRSWVINLHLYNRSTSNFFSPKYNNMYKKSLLFVFIFIIIQVFHTCMYNNRNISNSYVHVWFAGERGWFFFLHVYVNRDVNIFSTSNRVYDTGMHKIFGILFILKFIENTNIVQKENIFNKLSSEYLIFVFYCNKGYHRGYPPLR